MQHFVTKVLVRLFQGRHLAKNDYFREANFPVLASQHSHAPSQTRVSATPQTMAAAMLCGFGQPSVCDWYLHGLVLT
jgi:hypothetical protein